MIYTSPAFWRTHMGDSHALADAGYKTLWIAAWGVSSPSVPAKQVGLPRALMTAMEDLVQAAPKARTVTSLARHLVQVTRAGMTSPTPSRHGSSSLQSASASIRPDRGPARATLPR